MNWSASRIHFLLLIAYAFTLPFNEPYSKLTNVIMLLLAANWLRVHELSLRSATLVLMLCFYILHVVGLLHTENMKQGIFELDKKIGFLIFPIVLPAFTLDKDSVRRTLTAFAAGTILASLICVTYAGWQFFSHGSTEYFYYHPLTDVIDMHAIYMAMYVAFTIFILIYYYFWKVKAGGLVLKAGFFSCLSYLIIFIFLLSARTIILSFSLIVFAGILTYGYRKKMLLKAAMIIGALLILFTSLILLNDNNRERFKEAINYNSEYTIDQQYGGRSTRELIWNCAVDVIVKSPLMGWGTGDAQDVLHQCYLDSNYGPLTYLPELKYNAHSQYLQSWIDLGIPGLILLVLLLVIPFFLSVKSHNYLLTAFIALFTLACMTESMLELKQGITFFAFFLCLLSQREKQLRDSPLGARINTGERSD